MGILHDVIATFACPVTASQSGAVIRSRMAVFRKKSERANVFLISLDEQRQWYRYHHLFADFLRAALPQEQQPALHREASKWYESNRFTTEAIHHALKAEDFDTAAALITRYHDNELKQGG